MPGAVRCAERGWPAVRRRPGPGHEPGTVPAATVLPATGGAAPCRSAFSVPLALLRAVRPPPLLADALAGGRLPPHWSGALVALGALGAALDLAPRLYGSALWQCMTGDDHLRDRSDLDLLWVLGRPRAQARPLLAGLRAIADRAGGPPLDGEIRFGRHGDASWREIARADDDTPVLLRHAEGIGSAPCGALLGLERC